MHILFIKHFFCRILCFLRYIECPYSGTVHIRLLSSTDKNNNTYICLPVFET